MKKCMENPRESRPRRPKPTNDVLVESHGFCEHILGILIVINAALPICLGLLSGYQIKIIIRESKESE